MISTKDLIAKFQYAIDVKGGYIWGQAGAKWTEEKQKAATREQTVKYGSRWIGHQVWDCSGLFYWAFKQLGSYMYHGSNTMYRSYCTAKGPLSKGMELKPGTAVFTGTENDHGHVGLYIGNGTVIEAKGTQSGVITSKVTDKKWTYWGELKDVNYGEDTGFPENPGWRPTIRRGSKGTEVKEMQTMLDRLGYDIGPAGIDGDFGRRTEAALKEFQHDNGLGQDGVCGPLTWDALDRAVAKLDSKPKDPMYTVSIPHLDRTQAEALQRNYPGSIVTEE